MAKDEKRNGRYKGDGWAAKVLERIYGNKRLSIFAPLGAGAVVYVLFLVFGTHPAKAMFAWLVPILAAVSYAVMLLGLRFLLWTFRESPKRQDYCVLFFTAACVLNAVTMVPGFLFDLKEGVQSTTVGYITAISAIALVQSRRI